MHVDTLCVKFNVGSLGLAHSGLGKLICDTFQYDLLQDGSFSAANGSSRLWVWGLISTNDRGERERNKREERKGRGEVERERERL